MVPLFAAQVSASTILRRKRAVEKKGRGPGWPAPRGSEMSPERLAAKVRRVEVREIPGHCHCDQKLLHRGLIRVGLEDRLAKRLDRNKSQVGATPATCPI